MKLLIVDDSEAQRIILKRCAISAGFQEEHIFQACDGKEGIRMVQAKLPDYVVTDLNMPNMNGQEFIEAIRKENQSIRVALISSSITDQLQQDYQIYSIELFIPKPFTPQVLITYFKTLFQEKELSQKEELQISEPSLIESLDHVCQTTLGDQSFSIDSVNEILPEEFFGSQLTLTHSQSGKTFGFVLFSNAMGCQKLSAQFMSHQLESDSSDTEALPDFDLADAIGELLNMSVGGYLQRASDEENTYLLSPPIFSDGNLNLTPATPARIIKLTNKEYEYRIAYFPITG